MIELNLLPDDLKALQKKVATKIKIPHIPVVPLAIGVGSLILLFHLGLAIFVAVQKGCMVALDSKLKAIAPQEQKAGILKQEADKLTKTYSVIDSLTSGTLVWSKKLYELSETITEGVWLTSLSLQVEQPKATTFTQVKQRGSQAEEPIAMEVMVLKGSAVSQAPGEETAVVGKFIKSLKAHADFFSDFEDIKLSSIQRKKIAEVEVMDFTVVCYFKSGRIYFEKLEKS